MVPEGIVLRLRCLQLLFEQAFGTFFGFQSGYLATISVVLQVTMLMAMTTDYIASVVDLSSSMKYREFRSLLLFRFFFAFAFIQFVFRL